jgi:hypothetical protein
MDRQNWLVVLARFGGVTSKRLKSSYFSPYFGVE